MRRSSWLLLIASVGLTAGLAGCGGSSSPISGTPPGNTEVGYNFTGGTPTAAAVQIGAGSFAAATLTIRGAHRYHPRRNDDLFGCIRVSTDPGLRKHRDE